MYTMYTECYPIVSLYNLSLLSLQVVTCCHMMRELQHLHACFNQISQLCNIADIVPNLSLVNLESNIIEDWQQVLMLGDLQK